MEYNEEYKAKNPAIYGNLWQFMAIYGNVDLGNFWPF